MTEPRLTKTPHFFYEWAILCGALLVLGGFIAYAQLVDYRQLDERERDRLMHQTEIVEKNLVPQLISTNRAIEGIIEELPSWKAESDGFKKTTLRLKVIDDSLPGVSPIVILNADGTVVSSSEEKLIGMNLAQQEYFQTALRNPDPAVLHISAPFKTVLDTFVISLFRTIPGPNGKFGGIVIVSAVPDYFRVLLDSVRYAPDARTSIVHGDGKVFMVSPPVATVDGDNLARPGTLFTRHRESGQSASFFAGATFVVGGERMVALRTIAPPALQMDKPLVVTVSRSSAEVFSAWRKGLYIQSLLFAVMVIFTVLGLARSHRGRRERFAERRQAENRINELLREHRLIFDNAHVGIGMVRQRHIVHCNQRMAEIFGYASPAQLEGKSAEILYGTVEEFERVGDHLYPLMAQHGTAQGEVEMCRRDGTRITVRLSGRAVDQAAINDGSIWVYTDVTERKRSEIALKESEDRFRALHDASFGGIVIHEQGIILDCNQGLSNLSGYTIDELIGMDGLNLIAPDWRDLVRQNIRSGFAEAYDAEGLRKDGTLYPLRLRGKNIPYKGRSVRVTEFRDITESKQTEARLQQQMQFADDIVNSLPGIFYMLTADGEFVRANDQFLKVTGYSRSEIGNLNALDLFQGEARDLIAQRMQEVFASGEASVETDLVVKSGRKIPYYFTGRRTYIGEQVYLVGIGTDITERKRADKALRESEKHIRLLFNSGKDPIFVYEVDSLSGAPQGNFVEVNDIACSRLGYSREELLRMRPEDILAPEAATHPTPNVKLAFNREAIFESVHRTRNGTSIPVEINAHIFELYDRALAFAMARDITDRKAAEDEIRQLAFYDPLTHLPNRRLMTDRLKQAMANSARRNRHGALMMIDLDHFKTLNDTLGHDVGDRLLIEVASRLESSVRQGDTVVRLGGDEFVVILEDLDETDLAAMQAESVAVKILARLNQAYELDVTLDELEPGKHHHHCTASAGITLFRDQAISIDELMKRADTAMYRAKGAGRNSLRFFDPEMQTAVKARAAWESDLRKAIVGEQFLLHYQAQVDSSGRVFGAEALVRWAHPERGIVSPAEFIPLAEETGLILPLGHWVLLNACIQLASWAKRTDLAHLGLAVNVSARQFSLPNFVEQVLATIEFTGAPPGKLKLELTESLLLENAEDIIAKMSALKSHGVGFSMDDFGTGYSSLSYLKRLPLDQLKIDQSFVRDVLTDPNDAAIARTIVALAQSLDLNVIAEGVETKGQCDFLASHGCHAYQGYFFSRPLPVEEFEAFARRA